MLFSFPLILIIKITPLTHTSTFPVRFRRSVDTEALDHHWIYFVLSVKLLLTTNCQIASLLSQYHHHFSRPSLSTLYHMWSCNVCVCVCVALFIAVCLSDPSLYEAHTWCQNIANHRPVSVLLFLSKTLESAILPLLSSHLQDTALRMLTSLAMHSIATVFQ